MADTDRQSQLDFLRGLAALMVVANHSRGAFYIGGEALLAQHPSAGDYVAVAALQLTSFGADAVMLFFVLSGFAMAHSVSRSSSVGRFYLKRVVRIWPPYIAACLFAALIAHAGGLRDAPLIAQMLYIDPGNSAVTPQFWSLPFEVVFYALCPAILASRRRVHWLFAGALSLLAATAVVRGVILNPWPNFFANFAGNELFLFACGAIAYHHVDRIPRVSGRTLAAAVLATLAVAWGTKRLLGEVNIVSMVTIAAAAVLAIVNTPQRKSLNAGYFSYSIYLFHYALIAGAGALLGRAGIVAGQIRNPVAWIPLAVAVVACCFALYWVTERISNQWVARLRRGGTRERVVVMEGAVTK